MKSMKGEIGRVERVGMRRVALFKTEGQTQKQERELVAFFLLSRSSFRLRHGLPCCGSVEDLRWRWLVIGQSLVRTQAESGCLWLSI